VTNNLVTSIRRMVGSSTSLGQRTVLEHAAMQAADEIERLRDRCQSNDQEINMLVSAQQGWGKVDRLREAGNALALAVKTGLSVDSALENWEAVSDGTNQKS